MVTPGPVLVASNSEMVRNSEGKLGEDSEAYSGHYSGVLSELELNIN